MQLFPKEDILTGDQLLFEYEPEVSELYKSCFLLRQMTLVVEDEGWGYLYLDHIDIDNIYIIIFVSFRPRKTFHWMGCAGELQSFVLCFPSQGMNVDLCEKGDG